MELLKQKIFFKLKTPSGPKPQDEQEFKEWRNKQKAPIGKWKEQEKFTYLELNDHPNVGMVIPEGYIVIDIDDKEQSLMVQKALMSKNIKCIVSDTGKGKHFIFKDDKWETRTQSNGVMSLVGIRLDSRVSNKGYVAVKFLPDEEVLGRPNGERFTTMIDLKDVDKIPYWLEPIRLQSSEKAKEIVAKRWQEGNRDDSLMIWTNVIWNTDIDKKKELYEVVSLINDFMMSNPLFRNGAEAKKKIDGWLEYVDNVKVNKVINIGDENQELAGFGLIETAKEVDYISLAKHIKELFKIAYYNGNWWIKEDKPWHEKTTDEYIAMKFIEKFGNAALKADEKKFFLALKTHSIKYEDNEDEKYINFKNGKLEWRTGKLFDYSNDEFNTFGIEVDYKFDTTPNQVDKVLEQWTEGHQDEQEVLHEFIGSILYPRNDFTRGLILYGPLAHNGKSTFMDMVTNIIKSEYITSMNFSQLESRFGAYDLIGKRLLQIAELEDTYIEKSPVFKQVVGSTDYIEVEGKNVKNKVRFLPTVKFMGATNRFPRFGDQTNGIWRRLVVVPFNFRPTQDQTNSFDKSSLMNDEAKERLVVLAVEGLRRYMSKRSFTIPERSKLLEKEMKTLADPVKAHRFDNNSTSDEMWEIGISLSDLYYRFKSWCFSNGYKPLGRNNYKKHITDVFDDVEWVQQGKGAAMLKKKEIKIKDILETELEEIKF